MKCFELKNDTLREGLLITDEAGPPRVNVTTSGSFFLPLDSHLASIYRQAPKIAPIRQHEVTLSRDLRTLSSPRRHDRMALLLLHLEGGQEGDVSLSSCAFEERVPETNERVEKLYRTFPSQGVRVLGDHPEPEPWFGEAKILELVVVMLAGAAFRITRTGRHDSRVNTFLHWNGFRMIDTPHKKKTQPRPDYPNEASMELVKPRQATAGGDLIQMTH